MVKIPESLRCLFTASIDKIGDQYVIEIPVEEVVHETMVPGETYRVALLGQAQPPRRTADQPSSQQDRQQPDQDQSAPEPPVEEGEVRTVSIDTTGDEGDGIARVERGYVVIVQNARPGQEVTVKVEDVRENVAFAHILEDDPGSK